MIQLLQLKVFTDASLDSLSLSIIAYHRLKWTVTGIILSSSCFIYVIRQYVIIYKEVVKQHYLKKKLVERAKWVTGHCNWAAVSRNRYGVEKNVDTHKILINAIKYYVCLQEI